MMTGLTEYKPCCHLSV